MDQEDRRALLRRLQAVPPATRPYVLAAARALIAATRSTRKPSSRKPR